MLPRPHPLDNCGKCSKQDTLWISHRNIGRCAFSVSFSMAGAPMAWQSFYVVWSFIEGSIHPKSGKYRKTYSYARAVNPTVCIHMLCMQLSPLTQNYICVYSLPVDMSSSSICRHKSISNGRFQKSQNTVLLHRAMLL